MPRGQGRQAERLRAARSLQLSLHCRCTFLQRQSPVRALHASSGRRRLSATPDELRPAQRGAPTWTMLRRRSPSARASASGLCRTVRCGVVRVSTPAADSATVVVSVLRRRRLLTRWTSHPELLRSPPGFTARASRSGNTNARPRRPDSPDGNRPASGSTRARSRPRVRR